MKNTNKKSATTTTTTTPTTKKVEGRGRPTGSTATVELPLAKLVALVGGDQTAQVQVGRAWLTKFRMAQIEKQANADLVEFLKTPAPSIVKAQEQIEVTES